MTTLATNNAEGGTSGTGVSVGNSGGTSGTAFVSVSTPNTSTVKFSNAQAAHGSLSYLFAVDTTVAANTVSYQWNSTVITTSPTTIYERINVYLPALPPGEIRLFKTLVGSASTSAALGINSSGKIVLRDANATVIKTSTKSCPVGQWFRIEVKVVSGASTGQIVSNAFLTNVDNTTPDEVLDTGPTINTLGGAITNTQFGVLASLPNTGSGPYNFYLDDLDLSDSAYPGPVGTAPPPSALVLSNTTENGANVGAGTALTVGNSGGGVNNDNAFNTVSTPTHTAIAFSTAHSVHGAYAHLLTTDSTGAACDVAWGGSITTSPNTVYLRLYVQLASYPAATMRLLKAIASATQCGAIDITSAGNVRCVDSSGTTRSTSTTQVPLGQWFRIEAKIVSNASTGIVEVRIFTSGNDNVTPDETNTNTGLNTAGGAVTTVQYGSLIGIANQFIYLDDYGFDDTAYLGPSGNNPPYPPGPVALTNTFEGGTNAVAISTANSGGGSGTALDLIAVGTQSGTSAKYSNAHNPAGHGVLSAAFITSSSAPDTAAVGWGPTNVNSGTNASYSRIYGYFPALPTSTVVVMRAIAEGTMFAQVSIDSQGHVCLAGASGVIQETSITKLSAGQWWRLDLILAGYTGSSIAAVEIYANNADSKTMDEQIGQFGLVTPVGVIDTFQFGVVSAIQNFTLYVDDVAYSDTSDPGPSITPVAPAIGWGIIPTRLIPVSNPPPTPNSSIAVPGELILGYYKGGNLYSSQQAMEGVIGRVFKVHKFYCDASNSNSGKPNLSANGPAQAAASGGALHINFALNVWSGGSAATCPTQPPVGTLGLSQHPWFGFDDLIAGYLDPVLAQWGAAMMALAPTPIIATLVGEPDGNGYVVDGGAKTAPSLYPQALAYTINYITALGATNIEWSWSVSGWQSSTSLYASLWGKSGSTSPLDNLVTWMVWDPYIDGPGQDDSKYLQFYNNVIAANALTPAARNKYYGLGEWGVGLGGEARGPLFTGFPPEVAGVLSVASYWDGSVGSGYKDYTVYGTSDTGSFTTMAAAMS